MVSPQNNLAAFTVGDLARELAVPYYRVRYQIARLNIQPGIGRAGIVRLFDASQLEQIRAAIAESEASGEGRPRKVVARG